MKFPFEPDRSSAAIEVDLVGWLDVLTLVSPLAALAGWVGLLLSLGRRLAHPAASAGPARWLPAAWILAVILGIVLVARVGLVLDGLPAPGPPLAAGLVQAAIEFLLGGLALLLAAAWRPARAPAGPAPGDLTLADLQRLADGILATLPDCLLVVGSDGRCRMASRQVAELLAVPPETLAGRPIEDFVAEMDAEFRSGAGRRPQFNFQALLRAGSGRNFQIRWNTSPLAGADGAAGGFLAVGRDVRHIHEFLELRRAMDELRTTERLSRALAASLELARLAESLRALLATYVGCDDAVLMVPLAPDKVPARPALPAQLAALTSPQAALIVRVTADVARTRSSLQIDSEQNDDSRAAAAARAGLGRMVSSPLLVGEELTGVVHAVRLKSEVGTGEATRLLTRISPQLALSVRNALSFREERRARRRHRDSMEAMASMLEDLEEAHQQLQTTTAALRCRNDELESLMESISHDISNPVVSLHGLVSILEEDLGPQLGDEAARCLARIRENVACLDAIIRQMVDLFDIGRLGDSWNTVGLTELLADLARAAGERLRQASVELAVPADLPAVRGEAPRLRQLFESLLENSLDRLAAIPRPRIELAWEPAAGRARFSLGDNGPPLSDSDRERLFRFSSREPGCLEKARSAGRMAIVKRIVELHGGEVGVASNAGGLTSVQFDLPAATAGGNGA